MAETIETMETMETRSRGPPGGGRGPGRPRLPTPQRRQNILNSKAKWRSENREYYLQQKRQLACRPDYLARRRELTREKSRAKEYASYLRSLQYGSILDFSTQSTYMGPVDVF